VKSAQANHVKDQLSEATIEHLPIGKVRLNPRNARTHSKSQVRQIAESIKQFGFLVPILVDEQGVVLAGHGRLAAARFLGLSSVPTLCAEGLSEPQKRAFALADNRLAEKAGWDRETLVIELGELIELLPVEGVDISITGFDAPDVDALFADLSKSGPTADDALPTIKPTVSRVGDLWILGKHRVLCGDARSIVDMDRLLKGERAATAFFDPPYNVSIRSIVGRGRVKHREFQMASGELSREEFIRFLVDAMGNAARVSSNGALHYVCIDWRHVEELFVAGREVYGAAINLCVWNKTNAGQRSFYRSRHELVGVFRVGDTGNQNNIELGCHGRNRSNVWTYPGVNSFGAGRAEALASHPTAKPVALVADALLDCTSRNDLVLDSFLGSGSTVIAAEKVGRRCFGLECDPAYVDVVVRRWRNFMKGDVILEGDGRTFEEIEAERLSGALTADTLTAVENGPETLREEQGKGAGTILKKAAGRASPLDRGAA
jgi:DNA modification methylase